MTEKTSHIRSYVRRQGRMTTAQQQALQQHWTRYGLTLATTPLTEQFSQAAPYVLEIGFGMGEALLASATAYPDHNFLGIEVHRPGIGKLLAGAAAANLTNLKVIAEDAVQVLQQAIPDRTLTVVRLFFPDPWPKQRHHKRRLVQPDFIQLLSKKLIVGGVLHMATDWNDYAQQIQRLLTNTANFVAIKVPPMPRPSTRFEQRGLRLGHSIDDFLFQKNA